MGVFKNEPHHIHIPTCGVYASSLLLPAIQSQVKIVQAAHSRLVITCLPWLTYITAVDDATKMQN